MPRNPKRRGVAASNSFTRDEIRAVSQLLDVLLRGGDARVIAERPVIGKVRAKFARMQQSVEQGRSGEELPLRNMSGRVLGALVLTEKTTAEIARELHATTRNTYAALRRLRRKGAVDYVGGRWRRAA